MNTRELFISATVAAAVAFGAAPAVGVSADRAFAQAQTPPAPGGPAGRGQMSGSQMEQMMAARRKMQAEMAAQEKKLDELIAQMNAAKGAEKIERVAAALSELVAQHKAMRHHMMGAGGMMMPPPVPAGAPSAPHQGRGPDAVPSQTHGQHAEHQAPAGAPAARTVRGGVEADDEEMCRPPV